MVASTSFLAFGLLSGFAYLAHSRKRELLSYGLAATGIAFLLEGVRVIVGPNGFGSFLDILHHVAFGVGGSFLAYVTAVEGWRFYKIWKQRRLAAEEAFRAKMVASKAATPVADPTTKTNAKRGSTSEARKGESPA